MSKDQPYTEVESVKAVSDVFAPLSGEIAAVNEHWPTSPRRSTRTLREGWLVKGKLSDPAEAGVADGLDRYQAY